MALRWNTTGRSINLSVYVVLGVRAVETVLMESIISNSSERLRISVNKAYAELRSMQMTSVVNLASSTQK